MSRAAREYTAPGSVLLALDLDEAIASSGEHPEMPTEPTQPAEPVGIVLSGTDGEGNRDLLNALLAGGDVRLAPGEYPIAPGIVIDGRTLDLGGARLIGTEIPLHDGAYFELRGKSPCLRNGRFSGHYAAAPGEEGYVQLETAGVSTETPGVGIETAVGLPVGDFGGALIEGVAFDHVSGYVICPRGGSTAVRQFSPEREPDDGWSRFRLLTDCPLITARHGVGYNYCISREPVRYRFYGAGGDLIGEVSGIPGEAVRVPDGASDAAVRTTGGYLRYCLYEYRHDNSLTVRGCVFRCNQRLGIANLPGESVVEDCVSVSNGYPREDHTGIRWDSSTSGFIDIEDVQSPRLTVRRCGCENEHLGVASRAYLLTIEDCPGMDVFLYGGWEAEVRGVRQVYFIDQAARDAIALTTDSPWRVLY